MFKKLILVVLLVATFLVAGEAMRIHQERSHRLNTEQNSFYLKHNMARLMEHKFSKLFDLEHKVAEEPMSPQLQAFMKWITSDQSIMASAAKGQKLSDKNAKKIKDYFLNNPLLLDEMMSVSSQGQQEEQCVSKFDQGLKRKFYALVLNEIDFSNMFVSAQAIPELTEKQLQNIQDQAQKDPELMKAFGKCQ